MPDEQSAAGNIGGGDDYGSFRRAADRAINSARSAIGGFILPNGGNGSNPSAAGSTAALTSSLNLLSSKIDSLIQSLDKVKFGGNGTSGVSNTATSGKKNGGDSFFSNPAVKWGLGTAALGAAGFSSLYNNQLQTSSGIYTTAQSMIPYTGMNGQQGLNSILRALKGGFAGGTSGQDVMNAAAMITQQSMMPPGTQRGNLQLQYSSLLARTLGTDISTGAQNYLGLTQNAALQWRLRPFGGGFVGPGGSMLNPYQAAMSQVSNMMQITGANPSAFNGPGGLAYWQQLMSGRSRFRSSMEAVYGDQTNTVQNMITQQLNAYKQGMSHTQFLNPNMSAADFKKYGLVSPIMTQMQKFGIGQQQYDLGLAMSQQQNNAAMLATLIDIRKFEKGILNALGGGSRIVPLLSGMKNFLAIIAAAKWLGGGRAAASTAAEGGAAGGSGGLGGVDAAIGADAGTTGPIGLTLLGSAVVSGTSHHFLGTRPTLQGIPVDDKPGSNPNAHPWWQFWHWKGIGDPPASGGGGSDTQFVESRSNTGPGGVTGLQPTLLHDVAMMMKANPRLRLNSGFRTYAQQKALWARDPNGTMVAPPGSSMHEKGLAVDLGPSSEYGWLRHNAGKYGLVNYAPEPWHWEPRGASSAGNRTDYGVSGTAPGGSSGAVNAGASTSGSFSANMKSAAAGTGHYGLSQASLMASILGAPTEQGSSAYHYTSGSVTATIGGGSKSSSSSGGGSGILGPLPTGGDKRVPGHSITQWAHDLLVAMGITPTPTDMDAMIKWANHESGGYNPSSPGGLYNPLNSTESHFGYARNGGAQGNIKDYASYQQGIQNLAWNLTQTKGVGYDKILAALRAGSNESAVFQAIDSSKFGTHGLGDPPPRSGRASGGGTIAMTSKSMPVTATFNIYPPASADGKKIAHAAFNELNKIAKRLEMRDA